MDKLRFCQRKMRLKTEMRKEFGSWRVGCRIDWNHESEKDMLADSFVSA